MIGVFGGSFDPVHHGHLLVAQAALEALGLERVLFVPSGHQPLKGGHEAPPAARAEMVRLAIAGEPRFLCDTLELERGGPSYTVDTLRALRARLPGQPLALLVGADAAADLAAWREPEEIRRLAELVVLTRPGRGPEGLPAGARLLPVPQVDISATTIRARVRAGRSVRYWVPDAVADFMASARLYSPHA